MHTPTTGSPLEGILMYDRMSAYLVSIIPFIIHRKSFNKKGIPEWTKEPSIAGGGVLMDGTVHWTRSLRLL